ncbi:MAG: roadblock/LC7 domain-containing protein [Methanoregula sp.]|nr:roadblock/LC7 domain-containing protein [Methanoregula sp.]
MLKETLNRFLIIKGVQAAIVVQENGEIIESMKSGISLDDELQSVIATIMLDSHVTAKSFGDALLSMVFLEYTDNFLILGPLMEEFFLVIIAKNTANIGQITYEMKKNQDSIVAQL